MQIKKWVTLGCISALLSTSTISYAGIFPTYPDMDTTTNVEVNQLDAGSNISTEDIQAKLGQAARIVDQQTKEEFEQRFNAMSPQEKYDYLLPIYLEELRMLYAQMKMMEQEVMNNQMTMDFSFDSFEQKVFDYKQSLEVFNNIGQYQYGTTTNLYNGATSIESMIKKIHFIEMFVGSYNPDDIELKEKFKKEYDAFDKDYTTYYKTAFEFSLMREFDITIDTSVSRSVEDSIKVHSSNIEQFEQYMEDIIACGDTYSKGKADPDLYKKASHGKGARLNLYNDMAMTLMGGQAAEHPELSPLGYDAAAKISEAADKTSMFIYYYKSDNKKEKEKEMRELQEEATSALNAFKKRCNELLPTADEIDKNILQHVADAKANREKIAKENGYNSWFEYQLGLEEIARQEREEKIVDQATDLAIEQKKEDEERARRAQEAYEQKMRERIDFSKPLSQQNYGKEFYMKKSQARLEYVFGDSAFVGLGLSLDSEAFDELFRIRANGGNITILQELFDENPFEFSTILQLYRAYQ
jgi:hypothetical protein